MHLSPGPEWLSPKKTRDALQLLSTTEWARLGKLYIETAGHDGVRAGFFGAAPAAIGERGKPTGRRLVIHQPSARQFLSGLVDEPEVDPAAVIDGADGDSLEASQMRVKAFARQMDQDAGEDAS